MLPLFDENPTRRFPIITVLVITVCVVVYTAPRLIDDFEPTPLAGSTTDQQIEGEADFHLRWATVPCEITRQRPLSVDEISSTFAPEQRQIAACADGPPTSPARYPEKNVLLAIGSSIFLHGGLFHLAVNALFLWVFGNNVEDRLGHLPFLLFFLLGGIVATLAHVVAQPDSTLPVIGASGAIATIMGTYLVWFPDAPIRTLLFLILVDIRARWFLAGWFAIQFFTATDGAVAWVSHVAGFLVGVIAGTIIRRVQPRLRFRPAQLLQPWDRTGGAGHGPLPHLDEVWEEPHPEAYE